MADDQQDPDATPDADLGEKGTKALEAERKARRDAEKQLKAVNDRLKELEDKDKSQSEKLTGRLAELEKELAEARGSAMRLEVALDKGLSKAQAKRLVGDSADDLIADADELLASFKAPEEAPKPGPPGGAPKENLRPGAAPENPEPSKDDIRKAVAQIPRG